MKQRWSVAGSLVGLLRILRIFIRIVSTFDRREKSIQGFGGGPGGERPFGRPRCRWEGNIEMDLQKVGWGAKSGMGRNGLDCPV